MGAVSQIIQPISTLVTNVVQDTSNALTGALQPVEKAVSKGITDVGKTIADNPALEGAITAIGAAYGVPPAATAAFLAANKTSQTGGNLEKGLETLVLSYGAGRLMAPIDLSTPAAANQTVAATQAAVTPAATPLANLTPAAMESGIGAPGYGVNASAEQVVNAIGANPAYVGSGSLVGAPSMSAGTSLGNIGSTAGVMGAGGSTAAVDPTIAAMGNSIPATGMSAQQAVAAGMSPGAAGATGAAGLNAEQLAAATGTTGAGSALNGLATAGNASALTDALSSGSSGLIGLLSGAGSAIGNTLGNLSGTQLAALGTGAAGLYNASATRQAMQDAIGATQAANAASQGTLGNIYNQQLGYQAPYQAAGVGAVNQLAGMTPYLTHQFNAADLQAGLAPNYDFMLQQGQQANQRAANVGGGALGGNALTGLNQYTQNYAGNAYQNAFNNYQSQRQNIYSDLAGIAGIGQTANTGAGTAGTNYGQGITNLNTNLANAQSANILGQAQVGAGGITNAANTAFLATLLGQNTPTAGTSTGGGTSISDFAKLLTGIKAFTG